MQQLRRVAAGFGLLAGVCHAGAAFALGFGEIELDSALNQPLDARIALVSLSENERNTLSVRVAPPALFERFGIERTALADELRVEVGDSGSGHRVVLHLSTRRPVREPFLRFLLEADTAEGRALREYTVLLDPPGQAPATPARQPAAGRTSATSTPGPTPRTDRAPSANARVERYGPVRAGETLSRIATRLRYRDATLDQMQLGIYRENPQAFGDDMSVLLRGSMLTIPAPDQIRAIDAETARQTVRAQRRASTPPAAPAANDVMMTAQTPAPPTTTGARLRLQAPRFDADRDIGSMGGVDAAPGFGRLSLPDFSRMNQASADAAVSADDAAAPVAAADAADTDATVSVPAATAPADAAPLDPAATDDGAPAISTTSGDAPDVSRPLENAPEQDVAAVGGGLFAPRNLLLLIGALVLLVLLLVWYRRRQYKPVPLDFTATDDAEGSAGGAAPSETRTDVDPSDTDAELVAVAPGPATVGAGVAPQVSVLDADRQMKVGLFDQARITLDDALRRHPEHAGLQDKRVELDYLAGDADGFSRSIERFRTALAANGVRWAGVAAMGRVLLPGDPRFAFGDAPAADTSVEAPPAETGAPERQSIASEPPSRNDVEMPSEDEGLAFGEFESPRAENAPPETDTAEFDLDSPDRGPTDDSPRPDRPMDAGPEPESDEAGDDGLRLDTQTTDLGSYDWQAPDVDAGEERRHDQGDEPGMTFELDTSDSPDSRPRPIETPETDRAPLPPIDSDEYDLGESSDAGATEEEGDTVAIRLDLARMYLEMEDFDSARDLLDEVIADGDDGQRETARQLLQQLP